jgi:hypothetical protein
VACNFDGVSACLEKKILIGDEFIGDKKEKKGEIR